MARDLSGGIVCNIGPAERRQRLVFGVIFIQLAIVCFAVLIAFGPDPGWRLLLVVPLWLGLMGIAQAQLRICVGFDFGGKIDPTVAGNVAGLDSAAFRRALRLRSVLMVAATGAASAALSVLAAVLG